MLQGTASGVGKSVLTAGLCRLLARRGVRVAPFKPQNMSNNAAVTPDGGEIGRAQALQARACGVAASVHMNPVLLKPQTEIGAQLVVQGKVRGSFQARDYAALKPELMPAVLESFDLLEREADWLPPWHVLLRVFRRLEAQGKIRGGRFVAGMSGEQYALPDAVSAMRAIRRQEARGDFVPLSAADPLNLTGIVTPGARVPALTGNRVLFRDGIPVATHTAGQSDFLVPMEPGREWEARQALVRRSMVPGPRTPN